MLKYFKNTSQKYKKCFGTTGDFNKIMTPSTPAVLHNFFKENFANVLTGRQTVQTLTRLKIYGLLLNAM